MKVGDKVKILHSNGSDLKVGSVHEITKVRQGRAVPIYSINSWQFLSEDLEPVKCKYSEDLQSRARFIEGSSAIHRIPVDPKREMIANWIARILLLGFGVLLGAAILFVILHIWN